MTDRDADVLTVDLITHGEFKTSLASVRKYEHYSKRQLAQLIIDAYGGGVEHNTFGYWLALPKTVLVIVYAGLVNPLN